MNQDKLAWMVSESRKDEINLLEDEIAVILATRSGVGIFSEAEVDYVMELSREWDQD